MVIVLRLLERPERDDRVHYCQTEAEAMLIAAANLPSKADRSSMLDDVVEGLSGNVIGPVPT